MFRPTLFALAGLTLSLVAQDFGPVVKVAGLAFPGRTHFGVVCHYGRSKVAVNNLLRALPAGSTLTVVDAHIPSQVASAGVVLSQNDVQLLALLPHDTLVYDGSAYATGLVSQVQDRIPAFGTTPKALDNGCAMALGKETNWELLVNPKILDPSIKGTIGPIEITPEATQAYFGSSRLQVITLASR